MNAIIITKNSGEVLDNSTWTNISSLTNKIDVSGADIKLNGKLCSEIGLVKKCLGSCKDGYIWDDSTKSCIFNCPANYDGFSTIMHDGTCYYGATILFGINNVDARYLGEFILNGYLLKNPSYGSGTTFYGGTKMGEYGGYTIRKSGVGINATKTRWRVYEKVPGQ
ncbi:MAG: hypothetical protein N4A38_01920 [Candidatus Gracilibacteria bacterium]|nr:hypothetical protein [Candidatus Gracilibacteria bacterium]